MMLNATPLFIGGLPGGPEVLLILVVFILLFGANRIPKLARATGESIGEFQKGREEVESELEEMQDDTSDSEYSETDDDYTELSEL